MKARCRHCGFVHDLDSTNTVLWREVEITGTGWQPGEPTVDAQGQFKSWVGDDVMDSSDTESGAATDQYELGCCNHKFKAQAHRFDIDVSKHLEKLADEDDEFVHEDQLTL